MTTRERGGDIPDPYLQTEEKTPVTSNDAEQPPYSWTEDGQLQTNPEGVWPIRRVVDDLTVWPHETNRRGEITRTGRPEPDAVAQAQRRAEAMRAFDLDLIAETPSHEEIARTTAQRAAHREARRSLEDYRTRALLEQERRDVDHEVALRERRRRRENAAEDAVDRQQYAQDPTRELVRLAVAERWLPLLGLVPAVMAIIIGAVNVYAELTRINPDTWLVNALVEPLFSLPLVTILLAQVLGALPRPDLSEGLGHAVRTNRYVGMEIVLAGVAVALNVVPHWLPPGHWAGGLVWLVVPAGLTFSAYLVPRLVTDIRRALAEWSTPTESVPTGGVDEPRLSQVSGGESGLTGEVDSTPTEVVIPDPDRETLAEAYRRLERAVAERWVNPRSRRGAVINPGSAQSIRDTLGVSQERSRELRDEWQRRRCQ